MKHQSAVTSRQAYILFAVAIILWMGGWWKGEHDSCVRGGAIRVAYDAKQQIDAMRAIEVADGEHGDERAVNLRFAAYYRDLARAAPPLKCNKAFPDSKPASNITVEQVLARARADKP